MKRQLFVMDPIDSIDPCHDTTYVLMKAAQEMNREIYVCQSENLEHYDHELVCNAQAVDVLVGEPDYFEYKSSTESFTSDQFELIWMREDPPFDQQYLYTTYLLDGASCPVINDPAGLRNANEKCFILRFPDFIPDTWVGTDVNSATEFINALGNDVVAKTLNGFGGEEVFHVRSGHSELEKKLEKLTRNGSRTIMLQRFLPAVKEQGDRRIIILGGEPIGGLTRYPPEGDFRANLHSGGSPSGGAVTNQEREIVDQIKDDLLDEGLHLVGLDLVDGKITEVNVTSPTCVQEINRLENRKLHEEIVTYAVDL